MITSKDLQIENISYTNKDYPQIFSEQLDLFKKVTNKFDPSQANESDPGVVLLKENAAIGDKLNYNIDKNILEAYVSSATQEDSMRKLTSMLGYNMKYYRSATTYLTLRYLGTLGNTSSEASGIEVLNSFYIKAFDTTIKTSDNVVYTLLEDFFIEKDNTLSTSKLAIQGTIKQLSVLNTSNESSNLVQLYNLDSQNRLFFPDVDVAENGIFINKEVYNNISNTSAWHRVDSLSDQDLGSKVFKFGYDTSTGYPYIEFPEDISSLIGSGLEIYYTLTTGSSGSVNANALTTFNSIKIYSSLLTESISTLSEDDYTLSNTLSTGGYDKETLTEAYNNYKKVINTFSTLVSCKDYSNYINNYVSDNDNSRLVSSCQVTDARIDPNYSTEIYTRDENGNLYFKHILTRDNLEDYCNIIVHGTVPISQTINSLNLYNRTFNSLDSSYLLNINNELSEVKTINHTLVLPDKDTLNFIEGDYTLKCNISTKYKVNTTEQNEIISNIKKALYEKYNASQLDFSEALVYDDLLETIQEADTRIKNISLDEPIVDFNLVYASGSSTTKEKYDIIKHIDLIINNIIAARLPIYEEDTTTTYDYTMDLSDDSTFHKYTYIAGIEGISNISSGDILKENETVQTIQDSFISKLSYTAYIYYAFIDTTAKAGEIIVKANQTYKIKDNQTLYIYYQESDGTKGFKTYKSGQFIKPNFNIVNTEGIAEIKTASVENAYAAKFIDWSNKVIATDITYILYRQNPDKYINYIPFYSIGTSEQIDLVYRNEVTLSRFTNFFFYIKPKIKDGEIYNEDGNLLFEKVPNSTSKYFYVLEDGEYFIYANEEGTALNILGSGTKLEYSESYINRYDTNVISNSDLVNALSSNDISSFIKIFDWMSLNKELSVVESVVNTYVDGQKVEFTGVEDDILTSSWKTLSTLKVDNVDVDFDSEVNMLIRSVMSISCSNTLPQTVYENQTINLYLSDIEKDTQEQLATITKVVLDEGSIFQLSPSVNTINSLGVLSSIQYTEEGDKLVPKYKDKKMLYSYNNYSMVNYVEYDTSKKEEIPTLNSLYDWLKNNNKLSITSNNEILVDNIVLKQFFDDKGVKKYKLKFAISEAILADTNLQVYTFDTYSKTFNYNKTEYDFTDFINAIEIGTYNLYISKISKLKLTSTFSSQTEEFQELLMSKLLEYKDVDLIAEKNQTKLITSYTPLYSFYDSNNIYNKLTLSKIDFDSSEFNIVGGSKK